MSNWIWQRPYYFFIYIIGKEIKYDLLEQKEDTIMDKKESIHDDRESFNLSIFCQNIIIISKRNEKIDLK